MRFAEFYSSYLFDNSSGGGGSFILSDSEIWRPKGVIQIFLPDADCFIERNQFYFAGQDSNEFIISILDNGIDFFIRNNVFIDLINPEPDDKLITSVYAANGSELYVEYNSFLNTSRIAVSYLTGGNEVYSPSMVAINNYWNSTDLDVINDMILDNNDTLAIMKTIDYLPFLAESHPDTPKYQTIQSIKTAQLQLGVISLQEH